MWESINFTRNSLHSIFDFLFNKESQCGEHEREFFFHPNIMTTIFVSSLAIATNEFYFKYYIYFWYSRLSMFFHTKLQSYTCQYGVYTCTLGIKFKTFLRIVFYPEVCKGISKRVLTILNVNFLAYILVVSPLKLVKAEKSIGFIQALYCVIILSLVNTAL
jgi:hypothetical protein